MSFDLKKDCTELFLQYREVARLVWNLGFWPKAEVRASDCLQAGDYIAAFGETAARLYEGVVLLPLGYENRVKQIDSPGLTVPFEIEARCPILQGPHQAPGCQAGACRPSRSDKGFWLLCLVVRQIGRQARMT